MSDTHIVIVGTGREGRIAADIFNAHQQVVLGFLETASELSTRDLNDISVFAVLGEEDSKMVLQDSNIEYIVTVGETAARKEAYELTASLTKRPSTNACHPLSWVSPYAAVGFGNIFNVYTVVNPNVQIGDMNHFHTGSSVESDARVGNYCTFNPGVRIGSNCVVEDEVFVGSGAIVYPGVRLGKGCMVGAGSIVLRDVAEGATVHGNPAK